jgi:hypothetical protein
VHIWKIQSRGWWKSGTMDRYTRMWANSEAAGASEGRDWKHRETPQMIGHEDSRAAGMQTTHMQSEYM